ncbi:armadillo-type protein [Lipomyces orientalis]|uniref:Armadillo-type protein n=1 Tax=Lipomyces orientalis TaxID=1233043 RepID=A0ACC3TJC7_9ASCO
MEDQIEQAVEIALNSNSDPMIKQQAMSFCNQVKDSEDGWQMCLSLFMNDRKRSPAVRFFALQVVDDALVKRLNEGEKQLDDTSLLYIKEALLSYIQREYNPQGATDADAVFMQNKLAQTITFFFLLSYPNTWPSFFDDLLTLSSMGGSQFSNGRGLQLFLRILLAQYEEIADTLIIRSPEVARRNTVIKDAIRVRDMAKLASAWMEILVQWTPRDDGYLIVENCLRVIGSWVSWIDISLIVTPQYMSIIFGILGNEALRGAACDTLSEIISKKMKSSDKFELVSLLNLPQTIGQLRLGSDVEFTEKVARLVNVVCLDLVRILDEDQFASRLKENTENLLQQLFPFAIGFLANEYDDTSSEVFPATSEYLSFLRKEKKRNKPLNPARHSTLTSILNTVILKIRYDESMDWSNGTEDSENEFLEVRGRLRLFQDAVAAIDENLFMDTISSVVINSLNGEKRDWRDVELGLFELGAYGDGLRNAAALPTKGQGSSKAMEVLNDMLLRLTSSNVLSIGHPSINLHYMELVVKNSKFFETHPQIVPQVLEIFVSNVGVHSSNLQVQVRAWYLFYRFIKLCKHLTGDIAETALNAISDLLVIKAEVPQKNDGESDMSADGTDSGTFDGRLYLFEACGILISVEPVSNEKQYHLLKSVLTPIFGDMEASLPRAPEDPQQAQQIHHDIMAVGTFARGINDGGKPITDPVREQFLLAGRAILVSLETLSGLEIIREASRFAFARMVPVVGHQILPEIAVLVSRLLSESSASELIDFMSFLGQLIHNFKGQSGILDMLDQLLTPLLSRVFYSLSIAANGSTDEEIQQTDIKKAYLNFMMGLLNNGMEAVLTSERNRQIFESVIQSIAHYTSISSDASIKKMGSSIYTRLEAIMKTM